MAVPSGYSVSIRQGLIDKGVNNADIGYNQNTGYVTVGGKDAIKSGKSYQGTNFSTQYGFNNDWDNFQKSQQPSQTVQQPSQQVSQNTSPVQSYNPYATSNPYDSQLNDTIQMLMNQVNNPQAVDVNAIYASPQYQAYQAQAQKGAQQSIRAAQESMGSSGFGRSTALGERSQSYQNDANEYLNTQVLPQLMAQDQAAKQQQLNNQIAMLSQLGGQQQVYDNRYNGANDLALRQGELTGTYLNPQAQSIIDQLMGLKRQAETSGITRDERTGLSSQADVLRSQLAAMGVDISNVGANVNSSKASATAGVQTLAAKGQDYNQMADTRNYDYQVGRDDVADAQWAKEFNEMVKQNGIQNAINWAQENRISSGGSGGGSVSGVKPASLTQLLSIWKASGVAPEGIPGVTPGAKLYDAVAARKAAEKSGGVKMWDAIKGIINSIPSLATSSSKSSNSSISDDDIKQYLK